MKKKTDRKTSTGEQQIEKETSPPPATSVQAKGTQITDSALSAQNDIQLVREKESVQFGPNADLLSTLSRPIPENWETLRGKSWLSCYS